VVVTVNGWSDWSVVLTNAPEVLKLRVKREKEVVHIDFAEGTEENFKMMRLAYLPVIDRSKSMMVGIMCASPVENATGFDIIFENLIIETIEKDSLSETTRLHSHYMFLHAFISFLLSFFTREM
jgi:regulation of enolase protein 1 (concanavalin A-like superfamily)